MSQFSPPAGAPVVDVDFTSWQMCNDPYPVLREIRDLGPLVWNKRGHWMTAHDKVCREILNRPGPLGQEGAMRNFFGAEAFISIDEVARHIKKTRDETFIATDPQGRRVNRCESIAWNGGCTDTNEFNYLAVKAMRGLGVTYIENQARV